MRGPKTVVDELKDAQTNLNGAKAAQFIGGDDITAFLTQSAATSDFGVTLSPGNSANFIITFTPTNNAYPALMELFQFFAVDNSNVPANAVQPLVGAIMQVALQKIAYNQWYMAVINNDSSANHTAYFKYIFNGTDIGTFNTVSA